MDRLRKLLRQSLKTAAKELYDIDTDVMIEPADPRFADLQTNLPFTLVKEVRKAPPMIGRELAESIAERFEAKIEFSVKGGFLNMILTPAFLSNMAADVLTDDFTASDRGNGERVNIEFVSANPTGPLNVVSARAAAVGDTLSRLMRRSGWDVTTEYYNNDAGNQIDLLGLSFTARMEQLKGNVAEIPEGGYHGEYLLDYAKEYLAERPSLPPTDWITNRIIEENKATLRAFGAEHDVFFSEREFRARGSVEKLWDRFREEDIYEKDGAIWFSASKYDESIEDYVIRKSDGSLSYIIVDVAYAADKLEGRGFDRIRIILGPDHHNHAKRVEAALKSLGLGGRYEVLILQQVNLFDGGEAVKMSKRAGRIIPMTELIEDIGTDVARYFFLQRRMEAHLDFDLELARKQSNENPIYYIQYAHARISNVLKHAAEKGFDVDKIWDKPWLFDEEDELDILRKIARMPDIIGTAAETAQPHLLAHYLHELAGVFHPYYYKNQIVGADREITERRLALSITVMNAIAAGLELLGINAPEKM